MPTKVTNQNLSQRGFLISSVRVLRSKKTGISYFSSASYELLPLQPPLKQSQAGWYCCVQFNDFTSHGFWGVNFKLSKIVTCRCHLEPSSLPSVALSNTTPHPASAMLTACNKIQVIFMLRSKQERTSSHASDCTSYEFLSVHYSDMKEFLAYKVVWDPEASSSSPGPFPLTFRLEHGKTPPSAF